MAKDSYRSFDISSNLTNIGVLPGKPGVGALQRYAIPIALVSLGNADSFD